MKCQLESFLVAVDGEQRTWTPHMPSKSQTVCRTHGWQFQLGATTTSTQWSDMCPIGRIEDAVEKGVQRILDAVSQAQPGSGAVPKYDPDGLPLGYLLHFYHDKVPKGWEIIQTITFEGAKPIVLCKKVGT